MPAPLSVVMMGATGAVGGQVLRTLTPMPELQKLTLLGRRPVEGLSGDAIHQHAIDIFDPGTYRAHLAGHQAAICTLGVGEPSSMSKAEFVRIDHDAVLAFATEARAAGVAHFELLSSVGADAASRSFYLRKKGQLEDALTALGFDRLSLFHPSMILTPTNRYGLSQAVVLATWPYLNPLLAGPARKLRGIPVERLGAAIASNISSEGQGVKTLEWDDIMALSEPA